MEIINTFYDDYAGLAEFVDKHQEALARSDKAAVLVQVFSGQCEQDYLERLTAQIAGLLPHACIIGTSTSGEIMNGQVSGLKTVLSFAVFRYSQVTVGCFVKGDQDDYELGQQIASELGRDKAKVLILFSTGMTVNANKMLRGITAVYPELLVAGGNAGNYSLTEQSSSIVFSNSQFTANGVVGALVASDQLTVTCYSHLGWQPIGKEMTVTKANGTRVYTIDNIPAYEVYQKYLGLDKIGSFSNVIEYPLIINKPKTRTARTPNAHYADGSLGFAGEIAEGEKVRLSFGHVGMIGESILALCQEIKQHPIEGIYVYSCECRRGFLQELSKIETEPLQEIAPTAGFFTHGEFFHAGGTNHLLNATMTVLALSEASEETKVRPAKVELPDQDPSTTIDKVAGRNTGVLKALTHLVNTVTAELEAANEKLQYISFHDALTGLYNRAFFEQELERFSTLDTPVGIIVADLDCLKAVNDCLGHDVGDRAIQSAADAMSKSCRKGDIVARIGGDEFAILVADATLSVLEDICSRIVSKAASYKDQSGNIVYLSLGFALRGNAGEKSMREAFKQADAWMYRNKAANKAKISRQIFQNSITTNG